MTNKDAITNLLALKTAQIAQVGIDIDLETFDLAIKALEERQQGEWIEGKNGTIKCDQCGCEIRYSYLIGNKPDLPKVCCDCGADMKGGADMRGNNEK